MTMIRPFMDGGPGWVPNPNYGPNDPRRFVRAASGSPPVTPGPVPPRQGGVIGPGREIPPWILQLLQSRFPGRQFNGTLPPAPTIPGRPPTQAPPPPSVPPWAASLLPPGRTFDNTYLGPPWRY